MMTSCKIEKEKLQAFAENLLSEDDEVKLLEHLRQCEACQGNLWEVFQEGESVESLSSEEISRLKEFVKQLVKQNQQDKQRQELGWRLLEQLADFRLLTLAAADDQTADQKLLKAALATGTFIYESVDYQPGDPQYWRAEMALPSAPNKDTKLSIRITGSDCEAVEAGVFSFCGIELEVTNGRCYLPLAGLQKNLKNGRIIFFRRPDGIDVQGSLKMTFDEFGEL